MTIKNLFEPLRPNLKDRLYSLRLWWMRWQWTPWRRRVINVAVTAANALEKRWYPAKLPVPTEGKMLQFVPRGVNLGHYVISVRSVRGGFGMGTIEWSNQWGRPRFKADPEAIFDKTCIAEIYAAMRDFK